MRALVTGGTGFIGSNLALALERAGHEVLLTGSTSEQKLRDFRGKIFYTGAAGIPFEKFGKIDVLFHQGAIADTSIRDRDEMFRANVDTSMQLFNYAAQNGARSIVYASSTAVYGNSETPYRESNPVSPLNPYAESKAVLDEFAMGFAQSNPSVRVVGLRYCNVYGPGENHKGAMANVIYVFAQQMRTGNPRLFGDGRQRRDYIYVKDIVRANLLATDARENAVLNCTGGQPTDFNRIVDILNETMGVKRTPEYIENPYGNSYQNNIVCDISKIKSVIGSVPQYSLETGIRDYFESGALLR